jgi:hypothetical protein
MTSDIVEDFKFPFEKEEILKDFKHLYWDINHFYEITSEEIAISEFWKYYFLIIDVIKRYLNYIISLRPVKNFSNRTWFEQGRSSEIDRHVLENIGLINFYLENIYSYDKLAEIHKMIDKEFYFHMLINDLRITMFHVLRINESLKDILEHYFKDNIICALKHSSSCGGLIY